MEEKEVQSEEYLYESRHQDLSLLDLPDECILNVLDKLHREPHELGKIMTVCKRFYDICTSNRHLWRYADFTSSSSASSNMQTSSIRRRERFAQFLVQKRARLKVLRLKCAISRELHFLTDLILKCCSTELRIAEIIWTLEWPPVMTEYHVKILTSFKQLLEKLSVCSPDIYCFKTELDTSCSTTKMLGNLSNVHHLEVNFLDYCLEYEIVDEDSPRPIEIILSSLPKLDTLKVSGYVELGVDEYFHGHVLKSDSLKYLDFSMSKNLQVREIRFPKLHTIVVFEAYSYFPGRHCRCLFELIEEGCPHVTDIIIK